MGKYRELRVWSMAHNLALAVYSTTRSFPSDKLFGLSGQMRRAAVSVAANLAEGSGRDSDAELKRYARIPLGSLAELEYYVLLGKQLGYIRETEGDMLFEQVISTRRMLARLVSALGETRKDRVTNAR